MEEFGRALEIEPDNVQALNELAKVLFHIGRLDEAVEKFERAIELDSSFINPRFRLSVTEMLRGNYARSIELLRMLPVGSHGSSIIALSALNLHYLGRTDEGRRVLAKASPADRNESDFPSIEAIFHALAGDKAAAEDRIAAEIAVSAELGHFHHAECYIASARALMGEKDAAIDGIMRAADDGFPCYPWFERDPCLESLRDDSRFRNLIEELRARWAPEREATSS